MEDQGDTGKGEIRPSICEGEEPVREPIEPRDVPDIVRKGACRSWPDDTRGMDPGCDGRLDDLDEVLIGCI